MNTDNFNSGAINAPDCLSQGWNLIKDNYLLFLGMTVIEIVIGVVVSLIPFVGGIISTLIAAPLLCGVYMALLKQHRGEPVEFSTLFDGFNRFVPAVLVTLLGLLPVFILGFAGIFFSSLTFGLTNIRGANADGIFRGLGAVFVLAMLVTYLVVIVLQILLFFALPLIADRDVSFMDAVKLSINAAMANIGGLILLILLEILVGLAGVVACCIGVLFVMPIIYAANIIAYRQVFPDTNLPFGNQAPPTPEQYGGTYGMPQQ